ncbi:MAG TPA: (2Fe-2S)-binding protein, partial [Polyangiaceae bacterium]|nr:(2Fe-2S)-binding protein [Polyangiaceae bacterium]
RPDSDAQLVAAPLALTPAVIAELVASYGPSVSDRSSNRLTLSVIEGEGKLAFRMSRSVGDDVAQTLLEALQLAGQSTLEAAATGTLSRRELVVFSLVGALTLVLSEGCKPDAAPLKPPPIAAPSATTLPIVLEVNGQSHRLDVEPRVSLLDALRERLGLTGTKKGCDHGQCGACTVLIDDRRVNACLTLAVMAQRKQITTIEGLARGEALHPLQTAFIEEDALQCGFCTPGQIVSALGLLKENRARSDDEIREQMSGNICRCGAYLNIVRAVQRARQGAPT